MSMSFNQPISRTWCIAKFELTRLMLTKSGLLTLLAFTTIWFIILYYPVNSALELIYSRTFKDIANQIFGVLGLKELLTWLVPEMAIYWLIAIYSFPIFAITLASDQTCADRERGTLRFISLRATRSEIVYGRFIGQVMILGLLITLTLLATILMASFRDSNLMIPAFIKAGELFINLFIVVLPFVALMAFFNSFTRSSKKAIIFSVLFFCFTPLIFSSMQYLLGFGEILNYIRPGYRISDIINPASTQFSIYAIPLAQMMFFIICAQLVMKRSAL